MRYEVEQKFRTRGHDELVRRLLARGARAEPEVEQEDTYLAHPARDFARTNEALRIRRVGAVNRITYKGPRQSGPAKTREEIELGFEEGEAAFEQLSRLFVHLGFRPIAVLRKTRRVFHLEHNGRAMEIGLDLAGSVGEFAEVETLAHGDADVPAAQAAVLELAAGLGLTEVEPRSYLRMFLEQQGGPGMGGS